MPNSLDHLEDLLVGRSRHFCIYDDIHIASHTSASLPFSRQFELRSWLRVCLHLEDECLSTRSRDLDGSIKKKIEKWNFCGLGNIEIFTIHIGISGTMMS